MQSKKLLIHFDFMKETLSNQPMTIKTLHILMNNKFDVNYQYVKREVDELVTLKKIIKVKHNNESMLLWTKEVLKFEYELSNNIITIGKAYSEFHAIPSVVRQIRFPLYIVEEFKKKLGSLDKIELMLDITAVKSDGVWYKIQKE